MSDFSTLITNWYHENKRILPWREDKNPYKVWLSEVILQQTRVAQGINYYLKFIEAYPTIKYLALAPEDDVLKLWQGLGYYSRARNLHTAAKEILLKHKGIFPQNFNDIISLKGVGDYTASAIASISFSMPYAVVDGNVYRVLSRLFKVDLAINSNEGKKLFQKIANDLIDKINPGDYNQGLMELGALICVPQNPKCSICPVQQKCLSFQDQTQLNYPIKLQKIKVKNRFLNYLVLSDKNHIYIKKREGKDIWEGLYDFYLIETKQKVNDISNFIEFPFKKVFLDEEIKHILTHQMLFINFWIIEVDCINFKDKKLLKINVNSIQQYPLPQVLVKYIQKSRFFDSVF